MSTGKGLPETSQAQRFRIAVDTGGTFTDVVVGCTDGRVSVGKALTTYDRVFHGFANSVARAADAAGWTVEQVLSAADVIVYGTTHATNAVLTGTTAKTALLVTEGTEDTLILREGGRRNVFDSRAAYPPPYVPRCLTTGLRERISAEGEVLRELDEAHAREVIAGLDSDIDAVAVTLLWSVVNDAHERRVGELIEELRPGVAYTLSVNANPAIREYRRASAAAIDASLKPLMADHLGNLRTDLQGAGFGGALLVVTSEGAVLDVEDVLDRPVLLINSGPSMAPLVGAAAAPRQDVVVVCDMGGTTFDVSLVERGVVRHTREAWLGEPFVGHLTGLSSVAVESIGAGGGSIAWIDGGGLLRVGPQSARSTPGPAAYGRGGELPTVTDACVALGYLNADDFAGGFGLDRQAAHVAIEKHIARPLGLDVPAAAQAILEISSNHMATAIRQATLGHGVDPRGALIVAGGGAGAMVAALLGRLLDADRVLVPATAGVLAAYGAHRAPIATEFLAPLRNDTRAFDRDGARAALTSLATRGEHFAARFTEQGEAQVTYFVDARYPGQAWDLRVDFPKGLDDSDDLASTVEDAFHTEHEYRNGTCDLESRVEIIAWGLRVEIAREGGHGQTLSRIEKETVYRVDEVVFDGAPHRTPRYRGAALRAGDVVAGPAIIDQSTTTIVVPPQWQAELDDERNIYLNRLEATR